MINLRRPAVTSTHTSAVWKRTMWVSACEVVFRDLNQWIVQLRDANYSYVRHKWQYIQVVTRHL